MFSGRRGALCGAIRLEVCNRMPGAQRLRDAPGLRNAATRSVRCVAVENLAYGAKACLVQVWCETGQQRVRLPGIGVDSVVRDRERTEQPAPDRALVIDRVAVAWTTGVAASVVGMPWRQAAQAHRREQLTAADIHHGACAPRVEQPGTQRDREDLIGTQA